MDRAKKYTVPKQTRSLAFTHLCVAFVMVILSFAFLDFAAKYFAVKVILTVTMLFIYLSWLFSSAYEIAMTDDKTYVPLTPYPAKGFILSLGTVGLIAASWIFYEIMWVVKPIGETVEWGTFIATGLYIFITSPFSTIINVQGANASLTGQIFSIILPVVACGFGYFCGYKKWDYTKYIKVIMFEKKKNEKKK